MYLAMVGFGVVLVMMTLILKNKALPALCFTVLPVVGALIAGFSIDEILKFAVQGVGTTWSTAVLFIFSVIYFGIMSDAGMFDKMVTSLVKKAGSNITMIFIVTALIAIVGHLDGATASTYLITIPVMLPLYKRLHLSRIAMLCTIGMSTGVMNLVPWGGPTIRAASVIDSDPALMWQEMIPMQVCGVVVSLVAAWYFAKIETKRLRAEGLLIETGGGEEIQLNLGDPELKRPKLLGFNLAFTAFIIYLLIDGSITAWVVFMFATLIALAVNYPDIAMQNKRMMAHAPNCISLTVTLLCAGVFLGIFTSGGAIGKGVDAAVLDTVIIAQMAEVLINIIPSFLMPYLHIVIGILAAPIGMVIGPDPYYYAVLPLIAQAVAEFGVTPDKVAYAMLIGANVGIVVSPCIPTTFLALGLAEVELKDHIKFSFKYLWIASIALLAFSIIIGLV